MYLLVLLTLMNLNLFGETVAMDRAPWTGICIYNPISLSKSWSSNRSHIYIRIRNVK